MRLGNLMACLAVALLATGCSTSLASSAEVTLVEGSIDTTASTFSPGAIDLVVSNDGEFAHTLVVTKNSGEVVTATDLIMPGGSVELGLELGPGDYQFSCRIVTQLQDGTLVDHFQTGMWANVDVSEA